ncbi:MAG: peptide synthetase [Ruminococcus sp.]|nr:peptide synthetase [Ruminococcus sp.]
MQKNIGGILYDCYPLTPAQIVHIYTLRYSPTSEIVNIGTGQYFQMKLNIAALREALNRAVERCESMRLRFWKDPETGEMWQYVVPYTNEYFEYYDFSEWEESRVEEVLNKWTSQGFDTFGGKLSRIVIVSLPNGYNGYYFNVHHSCMDSSSVIAFAKDVIEIYCSLLYGLPYPKPMTSYIESVKKDLAYEGSKKQKKDEEYWHKQLDMPEPIYTDFTGPGRLIQLRRENNNPQQRWGLLTTKNGDGNTITYELDVDSTKKIMNFAKQYDLPVSVVILHAIRTVLSKFNDNETDICIRDFVSRRSTLLNKKCGGVRMHCFPLRTVVGLDETVLDSMRKIKKAQEDLFIHADYSTLKFIKEQRDRYNVGDGGAYYSVSFTYQPGTIDGIVPQLRGIGFKSRWYSSGKQPQPMYITAMHRPSDGGLNFFFGYQTDCATPEEIEFLYYFTGRVLFRSIENPDKTIKEIIDMT